ncbi:putative reverse transcriptase domain-containing protein [Tanacetum coccineum]|uniref:Reverse transcriptase domain-containing protein n=1 Tax=Tanacetum coccineum TaxID=301880 RepID=A0ABQ5GN03_9ASTR
MAAPVISILSDSSEEGVGSHALRVILFGAILAIIPVIPEVSIVHADPLVAPEVGAVFVTSPAGVLNLVDYSSSASDPSKNSLPPAPELPLVSPFLCFDDSKADSESEPVEQRPERHESLFVHDVMVLRLAWRRVSHYLPDRHSSPDFTSDSSSSGSSLDSLSDTSLGPPSDSLLVYPPVMTPCYSEAFSRWRSPTTLASSPTPVSRSIAPTHADLLPPHKRFKDSYSPEDSREEHIEISTADAEAVADLGIDDGVGAHIEDGIGMGVKIADSDIREDEEEFEAEASTRGTIEVEVDPKVRPVVDEDVPNHVTADGAIKVIETAQRQLKAVTEASANYEATRAANALEAESQSQNGNDGDNGHGGIGNNRNGNGNHADGGNNGNGNPNENGRGAMPVARVCTYQDFVKCQPLNFKGTEGVVGLTRWFKKMETPFHISNCPEVYQVKYAICTLLDSALTWWDSHKRTIGVDAVFAMTWRDLMKLMTEMYCPRNEIQKMETELWNLTVKNNDLAAYTQRFQELTLLYTRMVPGEEDRIERYVGGLSDNIQGNVMFAEPTRLQDAIRLANSLMDQKLKGYATRSAENKRKFESNQRDNRAQQPLFKRQNVGGLMWPEPIRLVVMKVGFMLDLLEYARVIINNYMARHM